MSELQLIMVWVVNVVTAIAVSYFMSFFVVRNAIDEERRMQERKREREEKLKRERELADRDDWPVFKR